MHRPAGKYFLSLVVTGLVVFLVVSTTIIFALSSLQRLNIYDIGVATLYAGLVVWVLCFLLLFSASSWRKRLESYLPLEVRGQGVRDHSRDFLWAIMISGISLSLCGYVVINTSQRLGIRTPDPDASPYVGSVRRELNSHMEIAKQWQEDADLHDATIWIGDNLRWIVSSTFCSASLSNRYLSIDTNADGSLTSESYTANSPICHTEPIIDDDWLLDSQDAIDIFAQNPEIRICLMANQENEGIFFDYTRLTLRRLSLMPNEPVVWVLSLPSSCTDDKVHFMDARTGEIIIRDQ